MLPKEARLSSTTEAEKLWGGRSFTEDLGLELALNARQLLRQLEQLFVSPPAGLCTRRIHHCSSRIYERGAKARAMQVNGEKSSLKRGRVSFLIQS